MPQGGANSNTFQHTVDVASLGALAGVRLSEIDLGTTIPPLPPELAVTAIDPEPETPAPKLEPRKKAHKN